MVAAATRLGELTECWAIQTRQHNLPCGTLQETTPGQGDGCPFRGANPQQADTVLPVIPCRQNLLYRERLDAICNQQNIPLAMTCLL